MNKNSHGYSLVIIYSIFRAAISILFAAVLKSSYLENYIPLQKKILLISTSGKLVGCFTVEIYHA